MEILKELTQYIEILEQEGMTVSELDGLLNKYRGYVEDEVFETILDDCCIVDKRTLEKMVHDFMFDTKHNNPRLIMEPSEINRMFSDLEDTYSEFYNYNYNEYAPKFSHITSADTCQVLRLLRESLQG